MQQRRDESKKYQKALEAEISIIEHSVFVDETKRVQSGILILLRHILASPSYTDFTTCRKAVQYSHISKSLYAEIKQKIIKTGLVYTDKIELNTRRHLLLVSPFKINPKKVSAADKAFYEQRLYNYFLMNDKEFVEFLYAESAKFSKSENLDTIIIQSVTSVETGVSSQSEVTLELEQSNHDSLSSNISNSAIDETSPDTQSDDSIQSERIDLAKVLETKGLLCFPVFQNSKELGISRKNIGQMGKVKRLEWIKRCEISAIWKKSEVDGYLLELMGDKYLEWLGKGENDEFWQMLVTRKRKQFETDRFMQDMGCFMGKHLVCLDADDKESYRLLLALLPENVLRDKRR